MPRRPAGPNYYPTRHAYFVQINRQHIRLAGPICQACEALEAKKKEPRCKDCRAVQEDARRRYHARMNVAATDTAAADNTVFVIVEARLNCLEANRARKTDRLAKEHLTSFSEDYGGLKVRQLKKHHLAEWADRRARPHRHGGHGHTATWGTSSRRTGQMVVAAAFGWAADQGIIGTNPFARLKLPPVGCTRGTSPARRRARRRGAPTRR